MGWPWTRTAPHSYVRATLFQLENPFARNDHAQTNESIRNRQAVVLIPLSHRMGDGQGQGEGASSFLLEEFQQSNMNVCGFWRLSNPILSKSQKASLHGDGYRLRPVGGMEFRQQIGDMHFH